MAVSGTLYGVGLGPGDPELLTLKAVRILRGVPVIAFPAANEAESFARAIAAPHLPGGQREVAFPMPMRVDPAPAQAVYDRAAALLSRELEAGRDVAVLCEGDPFFYGSFIQLFSRLARRFPVSVVPGIPSVMAAGAALRMPPAGRNESFAVIPATLPDAEIEARLRLADGFAILKLGRHFERVTALLARLGLAETCHYAERVSLSGERLRPLAEVEGPAPYFSLLLGRHDRADPPSDPPALVS